MTKANKKTKLKVRVNRTRRSEKSVEERTIDKEEFIDGFEEKVEHYVDDYVDKMERTKQLTLISGVGFFMLLILFFYAYNFKFQVTNLVSSDESSGIANQMEVIKKDIGSMVNSYKEIKEVVNTEINQEETGIVQSNLEKIDQAVLSELETKEELENVSIEDLKEKLLEKNIAVPSGEQE